MLRGGDRGATIKICVGFKRVWKLCHANKKSRLTGCAVQHAGQVWWQQTQKEAAQGQCFDSHNAGLYSPNPDEEHWSLPDLNVSPYNERYTGDSGLVPLMDLPRLRCGCFIPRRAQRRADVQPPLQPPTHHEVVLALIGGPLIAALWDEAWALLSWTDWTCSYSAKHRAHLRSVSVSAAATERRGKDSKRTDGFPFTCTKTPWEEWSAQLCVIFNLAAASVFFFCFRRLLLLLFKKKAISAFKNWTYAHSKI